MAAHQEVEGHLGRKGITFSSATPGVSTITAPNTTLSMQTLSELIQVCQAEGHELVFTAGALKIRPKDSNL